MTPKRERRAAELRIYAKETRPYIIARAKGMCQELGCYRQGTDPHHIEGRSGKRLNDSNKIILLCHDDHARAHANLKESRPRHLEIVRQSELSFTDKRILDTPTLA